MSPAAPPRPLILASASPRRLDLLRQIGVEPARVIAADIDETPLSGELPRPHVLRLADAKARAARQSGEEGLILAADTVVACGRRLLPKAETPEEVGACLALLSGRRHRVHGAIALLAPEGRVKIRHVETVVAFKRLTAAEIEAYLRCGEGQGKAGGYAIQGMAARFVCFLSGSYSNVVGLSLYDTSQLLAGIGFFPAQAG